MNHWELLLLIGIIIASGGAIHPYWMRTVLVYVCFFAAITFYVYEKHEINELRKSLKPMFNKELTL